MNEIIYLTPIFKEKIWGGSKLKSVFDYNIPSEKTGECWAISAHKEGDCEILDGIYKGKTLSWLYENHRELFGGISYEEFPLLVKLIDAKDNLSVQVHPGDKYAREIEGQPFGKTEGWYIVDCDEDSLLQVGHNASTEKEVEEMVIGGKWNDFLNYFPIKAGEFYFIPDGTVHAICKGTLVYEVQQSSDTTYRLYDYDRVDETTGKKRDLHISKSIDVITVPQKVSNTKEFVTEYDEYTKVVMTENDKFNLYRYEINGEASINNTNPFMLCTVIEGKGTIEGKEIAKGSNFIVPAGMNVVNVKGDLKILIATI